MLSLFQKPDILLPYKRIGLIILSKRSNWHCIDSISRSYIGAADWSEPNHVTDLAYQEEILMLSFDNKPQIYLC